MILKSLIKLTLFFRLLASNAFAVTTQRPAGIGKVADNLMEPVGLGADFVYTGCLVLGSSFLFAGIVKYIEHRRNPLVVPISTVVFLFLAGLFLLILPFAYLLLNQSSPYSLLR